MSQRMLEFAATLAGSSLLEMPSPAAVWWITRATSSCQKVRSAVHAMVDCAGMLQVHNLGLRAGRAVVGRALRVLTYIVSSSDAAPGAWCGAHVRVLRVPRPALASSRANLREPAQD